MTENKHEMTEVQPGLLSIPGHALKIILLTVPNPIGGLISESKAAAYGSNVNRIEDARNEDSRDERREHFRQIGRALGLVKGNRE